MILLILILAGNIVMLAVLFKESLVFLWVGGWVESCQITKHGINLELIEMI